MLKEELESLLLFEHSKNQKELLVRLLGQDPDNFKVLATLFLRSENKKIRQRAAWPLSFLIEKHPFLIRPYWKQFINLLEDSSLHPAIPRNILRSFQYVSIPEKYEGKVMDYCFQILTDTKIPSSHKAYAITILHHLSQKYEDIKPELKLILQENYDREQPAFQSRARTILKK